MTVNQIEGMIADRISNPEAIRMLGMLDELNGAYRQIIQDIRDADSEIADDVQLFQLRAGVNEYPLPANADSLRKVERFDLGGFISSGVSPNTVATPVTPVPFAIMDRAYCVGSPSYVLTPEAMVLIPTPWLDVENGLRLTWLPIAEELIDDDQVPHLPVALHDALAAKCLRRMLSVSGLNFSSPPAVADWIASQESYLLMYLNPSGRQAVTPIARKMSLYGTRRY